jgi:hypothetical protein
MIVPNLPQIVAHRLYPGTVNADRELTCCAQSRGLADSRCSPVCTDPQPLIGGREGAGLGAISCRTGLRQRRQGRRGATSEP